jgi:hypothetical protein
LRSGLESDRFPRASFQLGAPIVLQAAPARGQQVTAELRLVFEHA